MFDNEHVELNLGNVMDYCLMSDKYVQIFKYP